MAAARSALTTSSSPLAITSKRTLNPLISSAARRKRSMAAASPAKRGSGRVANSNRKSCSTLAVPTTNVLDGERRIECTRRPRADHQFDTREPVDEDCVCVANWVLPCPPGASRVRQERTNPHGMRSQSTGPIGCTRRPKPSLRRSRSLASGVRRRLRGLTVFSESMMFEARHRRYYIDTLPGPGW
jgi:hypothetical protein